MILKGGRQVASLDLQGDRDVVRARRLVTKLMTEKGAQPLMQTRFVTAVSEIARNAVTHGRGGSMQLYELPDDKRVGVEFRDAGPGIADLEKALVDGFSTVGSMGKGLGGAKRLAAEFELESSEETGTVVRMTGRTVRGR